MKSIRTDYKMERNKKIYKEYINKNLSYNQLAKRYRLTPQRIQKIIHNLKEKGLHETLNPTDKQTEREKFKNNAVIIREQGNLRIALDMFKQIVNWDKANNNPRGQIDVLGHIRITYSLLADNSKNKKDVLLYRNLALEAAQEAISLCNSHKEIPIGSKAIQQIHLTSAILQKLQSKKGKPDKRELEEALKQINEAIRNLQGSQAHKAWPANSKAKILYALGKTNEAFRVLAEAEIWLIQGYNDEIKTDDQAGMKLSIWKSGLDLARAEILMKEKKYILARHYANNVVSLPDQENILSARKKEAKKILQLIN